MARTFSSLEEKVDFALQQSEDALLAAAQKGGEAEVSKAEFAQYRIQFAMTLDERLNVNQVPVRLGDLLARLDVLEQDVAEVLGAASPEVSELLQRVQALEGAAPSPVAGGQVAQPGDQSAIARRLLALEDDVFSAASERSKLDHRIGLVEAPAAEQAKAVAAAKIAVAAALALPQEPFTGSFGTPEAAGRNFTIQFDASEPLATGYAKVRDEGFSVVGGNIIAARRVNGRSDMWQLLIRPSSQSDGILITPSTALRDRSGRQLSTFETATIR